MIINEVKLSRGFLFLKEEVVVLTSEGKVSLGESWNKNIVNDLDKKLKGFKLESGNDFSKLKNLVSNIGEDKYEILEKALAANIKRLWRFFDPAVAQVPRPLNVVLSKENGIKEFVVFSLNTKDFDSALNANRSIVDYLKKKIKDPETMKEEGILMIIKEAIDKEHELVDFEIRVGVVFDNFSNGKYEYQDKKLDSKQQFEFVSKLIEKYGVCYVENPFKEDDLEMYNKLAEKHRKVCLICINSKINEYTKAVDKKVINTLIVKFNDIPSFSADVNFFKSKGINLVAEGTSDIMDAVVGLGVPLVKLNDDKISNETAKKLVLISAEIVASKKSQAI